MRTLPEIAVAEADAATLAIYRRIMAASGTGTPALIVRHFAVFPGFLDWVWQAVGGAIESGAVLARSREIVAGVRPLALPPVGSQALARAGIGAAERPLLDAILTSYNRMNPMNHSLIAAIRDLLARPGEGAGDAAPLPAAPAPAPPPVPALPPPVGVADMAEDLQATMAALSETIPGEGPRLVPTLYRHLAIWPDLMRLMAPPILAAIARGEVADRMARLDAGMAVLAARVGAGARASGLPPPPLDDVPGMVRTLDAFLVAIPQMTVIGAGIERALAVKIPPGS